MDVQAEATEAAASGTEIPTQPPIQNRFLFVDVAALRAKQLRRGARPRLDAGDAHKAERVAMEEVRRGVVTYDLPPSKAAAGGREKP